MKILSDLKEKVIREKSGLHWSSYTRLVEDPSKGHRPHRLSRSGNSESMSR